MSSPPNPPHWNPSTPDTQKFVNPNVVGPGGGPDVFEIYATKNGEWHIYPDGHNVWVEGKGQNVYETLAQFNAKGVTAPTMVAQNNPTPAVISSATQPSSGGPSNNQSITGGTEAPAATSTPPHVISMNTAPDGSPLPPGVNNWDAATPPESHHVVSMNTAPDGSPLPPGVNNWDAATPPESHHVVSMNTAPDGSTLPPGVNNWGEPTGSGLNNSPDSNTAANTGGVVAPTNLSDANTGGTPAPASTSVNLNQPVETTGGSLTNVPDNNSSVPFHTVVHGDTMWDIAKTNNMSLQQLESYNPQIKDPHWIYPGEKIYLSSAGGVGTPPPTSKFNLGETGGTPAPATTDAKTGGWVSGVDTSSPDPAKNIIEAGGKTDLWHPGSTKPHSV